MLDINFIRENRELVKTGMLNKGEKDVSVVDEVVEKDEEWRTVVTKVDRLRAESNKKSKKIGELMGQGKKRRLKRSSGKPARAKSR